MAYIQNIGIGWYVAADYSEKLTSNFSILQALNVADSDTHSSGYWSKLTFPLPAVTTPDRQKVETPTPGGGTRIVKDEPDDIHNEAWKLILAGTTPVNLATLIGTLERILELAIRSESQGFGRPIYLYYSPTTVGNYPLRISRIKSGRLVVQDARYLAQGTARANATLYLDRVGYFEETEETTLTITNGSGSGTSRTVYDHDDADANHDNYVQIAAAAIGGDIPTPVVLELTNSLNDSPATRNKKVWVTKFEQTESELPKHTYEAENGTAGASMTAVEVLSANYSGGEAVDYTWTGTTELKMVSFNIATTELDAYLAKVYAIMARWAAQPYSNLYCRLKLEFLGNEIWAGPQILMTQDYTLQELGNVKIPHHLQREMGQAELDLCIYVQRAATPSTVRLDCIGVLPLDGRRVYVAKGTGFGYAATMVDNNRTGETYTATGSGKYPGIQGFGRPLMLRPNVLQILRFWWANGSYLAEIARTMTVVVKYRKRWRGMGV